jgi:uncharacterized protein (TIGR03435 family)
MTVMNARRHAPMGGMNIIGRLIPVLCVTAAALTMTAPTTAARQTLRFELESIRRSTSNGPSLLTTSGDRMTAMNFPVRLLIRNAYRLQPSQLIETGPGLDERYDIVAKSPQRLTGESQREMLRALLADRFRLVAHTEQRDLRIYALVPSRRDGRLGPQISHASIDCADLRAGRVPRPAATTPERPLCDWMGGNGYFVAGGIAMPTLADALSLRVDRPVVDRTALSGDYEFELLFAPGYVPSNPPPGAPALDPNAPDLFTALQEQLGLKLEPATGSLQVLVIDRIEHPSEN